MKSCYGVAALTMAMTFGSAEARAKSRLEWQQDWGRVGTLEYVLTATMLAGSAGLHWVSRAEEPLWTGPVLFDWGTREALKGRTLSERQAAALVSDGLALASHLPPLLVDPMFVAGLGDRNPDVGWQIFVISAQSYAATTFVNALSKRVFARQRPYADRCAADPDYSSDCTSHDRFRSFYSGHASITATGAGLTCSHHTHLPLYGGGLIDTGVCIAAVAGTLATGALRMVADKHWVSDVFVGHMLGFVSGLVLPSLLYYRGFNSRPEAEGTSMPLTRHPSGQSVFSYSGVF